MLLKLEHYRAHTPTSASLCSLDIRVNDLNLLSETSCVHMHEHKPVVCIVHFVILVRSVT